MNLFNQLIANYIQILQIWSLAVEVVNFEIVPNLISVYICISMYKIFLLNEIWIPTTEHHKLAVIDDKVAKPYGMQKEKEKKQKKETIW